MIERVAAKAVMHLELGPKTRETIKAVLPVPTDSNKKEESRACSVRVPTRRGASSGLQRQFVTPATRSDIGRGRMSR